MNAQSPPAPTAPGTLDPILLADAKYRAIQADPYLSAAYHAMVCVAAPGLGTFAVDRSWRCYIDPALLAAWAPQTSATVLRHEIRHLIFDHAGRADGAGVTSDTANQWNIAADAAVNTGLAGDAGERRSLHWPWPPIMPENVPGANAAMLAEEIFALLRPPPRQQDASAPRQDAAAGEADGGTDATPAGQAESGEKQPGSLNTGGADGAPPHPQNAQATDGSDSDRGTDTTTTGNGGKPTGGLDAQPNRQRPRCGSGAGGLPEPVEEELHGQRAPGGLTAAEGDIVRHKVAQDIRAQAAARAGSVPGDLALWAEEVLEPKVDWRRELASLLSDGTGRARTVTHTYRRPSRRHPHTHTGVIMPARVRDGLPRVAIVVDTSASMDDLLAAALAEVEGLLRTRAEIHVITCDTRAHDPQRARTARQIDLRGGGGTDMGAGLHAAAALRPVCHLAVVITDLETPWPATPPRPLQRVIVCGLGDGPAPPDWTRLVRITSDQQARR